MRRLRAVVIDDEPFIRSMLKDFLLLRGYEVLSYGQVNEVCPLSGNGGVCGWEHPCSDVLMTDFNMPGMNGVELLYRQRSAGCRLDMRNKAIMSGFIDDGNKKAADELGCMFFKKPFALPALTAWLSACEERVDLASPLATRRREERFDSYRELTFQVDHAEGTVTGVAVNVSRTGLCLKAPVRLQKSDRLRIDGSPSAPCSEASVRWVMQLGGDACMAGLQCASLSMAGC